MNIFKKLSMVVTLALLLGASDAGSVMAAAPAAKRPKGEKEETKQPGQEATALVAVAKPFRLLAMQDQMLGYALGFLTLQDVVAASNSCGRIRRFCMQPGALVLGDRTLAQPEFLVAVPDQAWLFNLCKRYFTSLLKRVDINAVAAFYRNLPAAVQPAALEYINQLATEMVAAKSVDELNALRDGLFKMFVRQAYHKIHNKYFDECPIDRVMKKMMANENYVELCNVMSLQSSIKGIIDWLIMFKPNFTALHLGFSNLTDIPAAIGNLRNLYSLHVNGNNLKSMPVEIGLLLDLKMLYVDMYNLTLESRAFLEALEARGVRVGLS